MSEYEDVPPEDPYAESTPQGPSHEQILIGALLNDARYLRDVQRAVSPEDFADLRVRDIFAGMCRMVADGIPVDLVTVADQLRAWDVRGYDITTLAGWQAAAPSAAHADYYAHLVREAAILRELARIGAGMQAASESGVALAAAQEQLRMLRDAGSVGDKSVRWLREVLDVPEQDDAYDWVIPDLLERMDRLMISAGEGVGKSTLLRQIGVLSAAGVHPFRFSPMDPINVLVVDAENSERQWRRATRGLADTATERGQRDPRGHLALHCVPVMDITRPNDIGQIHRWIDEAKPDLLILGPLYRMTKGGLKDDEDAQPALAALESLRERGVAMLIEVHAGHARSSSGERELRPRGSSALLGWPEFGLGLRRDKEREGSRATFSLVRWRGDRDRREWPQKLSRGVVWPWEPTVSI